MDNLLLKQEDSYEVQLVSIVTSYDLKILTRLYQPIIGHGAVSLYLTLYHEIEGERIISTGTKLHLRLLETMDVTVDKFSKYRNYLEGIGLMKTFVLEEEGTNKYIYRLFAPYLPNKFFGSPILNSLLKRSLSVEEYERTKLYFTNKLKVKSNYREVTHTTQEVFFQALKTFKNAIEVDTRNIKERVEMDLEVSFDVEAFLKGLKDYQIPRKLISESALKQISQIAALYQISALDMRQVIARSLDYLDGDLKLDYDKIEIQAKAYYDEHYSYNEKNKKPREVGKPKLLPGTSNIAQKIQLFNQVEPYEFLKLRNNNVAPFSSEIEIIRKVQDQSNLPSPVINVIIDYSLEKCNNKLVKTYLEKVAASLNRENILDAYEAMMYLTNKNKSNKDRVDSKITANKKPSVNEDIDFNDDEKWW